MADFNFELVSPERLLLSERVTEVVIPATEGEMTVMANHAPTMTTIKPGVVTVKAADGKVNKLRGVRRFRRYPADRLHAAGRSCHSGQRTDSATAAAPYRHDAGRTRQCAGR